MDLDLTVRVRRLERSNRGLRTALTALAVLNAWVLLVAAGGAEISELVRARRFELVGGEAGDVLLAEISQTPSGEGAIVTYSTSRFPVVELRPREGRGWLTTYGPEGRPLVVAGTTAEGDGALTVNGANAVPLVMARSSQNGGSVFTFDRDGSGLVELGSTHAGRGMVKTLDGQGHDMVVLGATDPGVGTLGIHNSMGHVVARIEADSAGAGSVSLHDGAGHMTHDWPAREIPPERPEGGSVRPSH